MAGGRGGGDSRQAEAWGTHRAWRAPRLDRAWQLQRISSGALPSPPQQRPGLQSSVPVTQPTTQAPLPQAWLSPCGPCRCRASSWGPRKWETADEAGTRSVRLWFTGSDLFFFSSRFAEIYENVFLIPRAHANCWRGAGRGGSVLEQSQRWLGARPLSARRSLPLPGHQAKPPASVSPTARTLGLGQMGQFLGDGLPDTLEFGEV